MASRNLSAAERAHEKASAQFLVGMRQLISDGKLAECVEKISSTYKYSDRVYSAGDNAIRECRADCLLRLGRAREALVEYNITSGILKSQVIEQTNCLRDLGLHSKAEEILRTAIRTRDALRCDNIQRPEKWRLKLALADCLYDARRGYTEQLHLYEDILTDVTIDSACNHVVERIKYIEANMDSLHHEPADTETDDEDESSSSADPSAADNQIEGSASNSAVKDEEEVKKPEGHKRKVDDSDASPVPDAKRQKIEQAKNAGVAETECAVCMDSPASVLFRCGHTTVCANCCNRIDTCPTCSAKARV